MRKAAICLLVWMILSGTSYTANAGTHLIGAGDRVKITVLNEPDLSKDTVVEKDGTITLPLIGEVKLAGLDSTQTASRLTELFSEYVIKPSVEVELLELARLRVFVVGEVKKPGMLALQPGARLLEAVASADYTENADLSNVSINRAEKPVEVDLAGFISGRDLTLNLPLMDGDVVYVRKRDVPGTVLVLGEVANPGPVPFRTWMSFREVMAIAGGLSPAADTAKITVKHEGQPQADLINLLQAQKNGAETTPQLRNGDTIFVPRADESYFIAQGGVNAPGKYPLKTGMTLEDATAAAGGLSRDARLDGVQVIHNNQGKMESKTVSLSRIRQGLEPQVVLMPRDTVVIPQKKQSSWPAVLAGIASFGWLFKQ